MENLLSVKLYNWAPSMLLRMSWATAWEWITTEPEAVNLVTQTSTWWGEQEPIQLQLLKCESLFYFHSPTTGTGKVTWSSCSSKNLKDFIKNGSPELKGSSSATPPVCLSTTSRESVEIVYKDGKLPGQKFDAKKQCKLALGNKFSPHITTKKPFNVRNYQTTLQVQSEVEWPTEETFLMYDSLLTCLISRRFVVCCIVPIQPTPRLRMPHLKERNVPRGK